MLTCFAGKIAFRRIESRLAQGLFAAIVLFGCLPRLSANVLFYSGNLKTDANVTGCDSACTLNSGDDDGAYAQWAAVVDTFTVSSATTMEAITYGFGGGTSLTGASVAAGGLEPYLSLFDSSGDFITSTFFGTNCPAGANSVGGNCYDVSLDGGTLAAGTYQIALTAYENLSFAENFGTGTLADGFTGFGNLGDGENLSYAFDVILGGGTSGGGGGTETPEPASSILLTTACAALAFIGKRKLRTPAVGALD
jgi:hypothetical protein